MRAARPFVNPGVTVTIDIGCEPSAEHGPASVPAVDGLTGANHARPVLAQALAACQAGDTLVVTTLDRLARSLSDARDIADELATKGVALNLGGSIHDPADPVGRLLFNVPGMVAEFEPHLIRMRTKEGLAVARAAGTLLGRQPKLPEPGSPPRRAAPHRHQDPGRSRPPLRHRTLHRLPRHHPRRRGQDGAGGRDAVAGPAFGDGNVCSGPLDGPVHWG